MSTLLTKDSDLYAIHETMLDASEKGLNRGIPFRSKLLTRSTGGILKGMYYLVVALSNVGKTRILMDNFILSQLEYALENHEDCKEGDVMVFLWALEMSIERTLAIIGSRWLRLYGKTYGYSDREILGVDGKPSPELLAALRTPEYKKYLTNISKNFRFFTAKNVPAISKTIEDYCSKISTKIGEDAEGNPLYKFTNPRQKVIIAIDHIGNVKAAKGSDTDRNAIMNLSIALVELKNKYGITPVVVQQANPIADNPMASSMLILREAKDTFIDADTVLIFMNPAALNVTDVRYKNSVYHILPTPENGMKGLGNMFRIAVTAKSRIGEANDKIPLFFDGAGAILTDAIEPEKIDYTKHNKK